MWIETTVRASVRLQDGLIQEAKRIWMAIKVRSEVEIEWRPDFDVKVKTPKWLNIQVKFKQKQPKQKLIIMMLNIYTYVIFYIHVRFH